MRKNMPILISALMFMIFWWWLGEQKFIYEMSESGKMWLSLAFITILLVLSYLIWKKD